MYIMNNAREMIFRGEYHRAAELMQYALTQLQSQNEDLSPDYRVDAVVLNLALGPKASAPVSNVSERGPGDVRIAHQEQFDTLMKDVHGRGVLPPASILAEILKHLINANDWAFVRTYFSRISSRIPPEKKGTCLYAQLTCCT